MKVGGNESATKYFQSHGGSAALASKDPKTKYTSNAASKYKDEIARRVEADQRKHPEEVVIEDGAEDSEGTGNNTPAAEADDFFSSWDKPAIKRPSNPPSRVGTPGINRTGSPFLNANGNGSARSKSPLSSNDASEGGAAAAPRAISSSAIRKTGVQSKPKPNILGAKKKGLGAKKVDASALDFDEAEKKAREEAERKERLGYDPDEEAAPSETQIKAAQPDSSTTTLHQPTPVSPPRAGGFGSTAGNQKTDGDMDSLGMGVRKLGFGQVGAPKGAPAAKPKMGFGAVSRAPAAGMSNLIAESCTHVEEADVVLQMILTASLVRSSARKRVFPPTNSSAVATMIRMHNLKPSNGSVASRARLRSLQTRTSGGLRTKRLSSSTGATWKARRETSCASLVSLLEMTLRTCPTWLARVLRSCRVLLGIT